MPHPLQSRYQHTVAGDSSLLASSGFTNICLLIEHSSFHFRYALSFQTLFSSTLNLIVTDNRLEKYLFWIIFWYQSISDIKACGRKSNFLSMIGRRPFVQTWGWIVLSEPKTVNLALASILNPAYFLAIHLHATDVNHSGQAASSCPYPHQTFFRLASYMPDFHYSKSSQSIQTRRQMCSHDLQIFYCIIH